ncbi:MAG: FHA domain-containing protein [Planctomycetota bacterium]
MAELLIATKDGKLVTHVGLDERRAVSIGRSERCDVSLTAPSISRRHAMVYQFGGHWHIVDVGSTAGMFTEQGRTRHEQLSPDRWVRIGPAFIWFGTITKPGARQIPQVPTSNDARVAIRFTTLLGARVRNVDLGADEECAFIGRGEGCDVRLDDNEVSRLHAILVREGDVWSIIDAQSSSGLFVDGKRSARRRLLPGRIMRIGGLLAIVEAVDDDESNLALESGDEVTALSDTAMEELSSFLPSDPEAAVNGGTASPRIDL